MICEDLSQNLSQKQHLIPDLLRSDISVSQYLTGY